MSGGKIIVSTEFFLALIFIFVSFGKPGLLMGDDISGKIVDAKTGKPLQGVNIKIVGSEIGTISGSDGLFRLPANLEDTVAILFKHVGYDTKSVLVKEIRSERVVALEPQPILLKRIEVEGERRKYNIELPTEVRIIAQEEIQTQAGIDLGEILRSEAALQIQSSTPAIQTISIRGCNPDQVLILYDGVPIQSSRDAIGEISWININDISEIQIIKGSQSTMFGEGGVGGVVNIEGNIRSPYKLTVSSRLGNYRFQDNYLSISPSLGNLFGKYSYNNRSVYYDEDDLSVPIKLRTASHNLGLGYENDKREVLLRGLEMSREINQPGSGNSTTERRFLLSGKYHNKSTLIGEWIIGSFYKNFLTKESYFTPGAPHQPQARIVISKYRDEVAGFRGEKSCNKGNFLIQLGGEWVQNKFTSLTLWDFVDSWGFDSMRFIQKLQRDQLGIYTLFQNRIETGLSTLPWCKINWSVRFDQSMDRRYFLKASQLYPQAETGKDLQRILNTKLGIELEGKNDRQNYNFYVTNGVNSRFPSLYDLYLNDIAISPIYHDSSVAPEKVISTEFGGNWGFQIASSGSGIESLEIKAVYFKNTFTDKIYYKPFAYSTPVALNAPYTIIKGWEGGVVIKMRLPVTLNLSVVKLQIKNKEYFPNKPDVKYQAELVIKQSPFLIRLRGFYEGQELASVTLPGGVVYLQSMQARSDWDVSVNYKYETRKFDFWLGLSAVNLMSNVDPGLSPNFFDRVRMVQLNLGIGAK